MPEELWTGVHDIVQEIGIKNNSKKKKYRKVNVCIYEEALQIAKKRRESKDRGEKEKSTH